MSRWSGSTRLRRRQAASSRRGLHVTARIAAAAALGAGALGGCTSAHSAASTESPSAQLQQAAGALDAAKTFRLTLDTLIPKQASTATATATATAAATTGPSAPTPAESVKMSGVWDVGTGLARMDGTINAVKTTILSAAGVEYVSLAADTAAPKGRKWLKVDDSDATFGSFCQPGLVAQLLRAYHDVHLAAAGHLAGTVEIAQADEHIADPALLASLTSLPDELRFDVWTDSSGAPSAVQFTLAGSGPVTTGTARLDSFGTAPAQVTVPTINDVVEAPAG